MRKPSLVPQRFDSLRKLKQTPTALHFSLDNRDTDQLVNSGAHPPAVAGTISVIRGFCSGHAWWRTEMPQKWAPNDLALCSSMPCLDPFARALHLRIIVGVRGV
jgi:hypothetical protein